MKEDRNLIQFWFGLLLVYTVYGAGSGFDDPAKADSEPNVNDEAVITPPMDDSSWFDVFKQKYIIYIIGTIGVLLMMVTTICIVYQCKKCKRNNKGDDEVELEYAEGTNDYMTDAEVEKQLI